MQEHMHDQMQGRMSLETLSEMRGDSVYDANGEKIGTIDRVFVDHETREPEWLGIGTGFLRMNEVLVPLAGATMTEDGMMVPFEKDLVTDSPSIEADDISEDEERSLYAHYGIASSESRSSSRLPDEGSTMMGDMVDDDAITRSEEELHVGVEKTDRGRLHLQKWVETEPVERDVTLHQETAEIVREPIDEVTDSGTIGEADIEVDLEGERPVVSKETVAKERIGVHTGVETTEETVTDEVRKERVDVEDEREAI